MVLTGERQFKMDERIAAARALSHFNHYKATQALVEVLRKENKNAALRDRANESLQIATGQDFPAEAQVWADYFSKPQQGPPKDEWVGKKLLTCHHSRPVGGSDGAVRASGKKERRPVAATPGSAAPA